MVKGISLFNSVEGTSSIDFYTSGLSNLEVFIEIGFNLYLPSSGGADGVF